MERKRSFLYIEPNRLDLEWLGQAELYYKWAKRLARAKKEMDEAKTNLDLVTAEADAEIRARPKRFGITKVTEAAIKSAVPKWEAYRKAQRRHLVARHKVEVYQAATVALAHRKTALQNLVALLGMSYFASPKHGAGADTHAGRAEMGKKRKAIGGWVPTDDLDEDVPF